MRRGTTMSLSFPPFTPAVKQLLIANGAVFLLMAVLGAFTSFDAQRWAEIHFGLVPTLAVLHGWIWQFVTYAFLHAGLLAHPVQHAGAVDVRRAVGDGLGLQPVHAVLLLLRNRRRTGHDLPVSLSPGFWAHLRWFRTVGASGGIYGILLAFGILHGDSEIMLFPIPFMIKAKYFVIGLILLAMYGALSSAHSMGQSTAYMAHLGGGLFGYLFLKFVPRRGFGFLSFGAAISGCAIPTTAGSGSVRRASSKCTCGSMIAATTGTTITSTRTATCAIPQLATAKRKTATRGRRG